MNNKRYIDLKDGKKLSYIVHGSGEHKILFFHGIIGGGYLSNEWIKAIEEREITLIAIERLGYGSSSKIQMNSVADFADIAKTIATQLNIDKCDIIGCSAGAPYAYATAYALGEIVERVFILGGVPLVYKESIFKHYSEEAQVEYMSFLENSIEDIQSKYVAYLDHLKQELASHGEPYINKTLNENIKQDCFGMAMESRLQIIDWGVPFEDIEQSVIYYHGKVDEMVPINGAKEMLKYLKNTQFIEVDKSDGADHMSSISHAFLHVISKININDLYDSKSNEYEKA
ncbi:alpha/beta hydrolase [Clostridiaceae bacterium M8S5]|nr:alpha/beta hydrolase [Clostridiaceae bacterium M8S5]